MIEEANKKLLGMSDLKKAVIRSTKKDKKPSEEEAKDVEEAKPLNCDEERANRENWKHPLDFLFSCISVSVGLGS